MKAKFDAILLLGLKLNADGTPAHELLLRIQKAAECYQRGMSPLIIPCGGQTPGTPVSEAEVMKAELIRLGIPNQAIHCEDKSQITVQNFLNARKLLPLEKPHVLIVTSDYHAFRSRLICRFSAHMRPASCSARIPYAEKRVAVRKEPLHTIDYILGFQSGKFKRPKLYSKIMYALLNRIH